MNMRLRKPGLKERWSWVAEDETAEAEAEEEERAFYHVLDEDEARPDGEANSSNCWLLGS